MPQNDKYINKSDRMLGNQNISLCLNDIKRTLSHPLKVASLGYLPDNWHNDIRHNWNAIFGIVLSAGEEKLVWRVNGRTYELRPPYVVLLEPGSVIQNVSEAHWEELYFCYGTEFAPILRRFGFKHGELREIRITQWFLELNRELMRVCGDIHAYGAADRMDCLCESIMTEAALAPPPDGNSIGLGEAAVRKIASFIEVNFLKDIKIKTLAAKHGMSYRTFLRTWKQLYDYTPQERITSLKIYSAKRMLLETGLRVDEIAYRLNFKNPLYFSRIFRRETGIPPSIWRKANKS